MCLKLFMRLFIQFVHLQMLVGFAGKEEGGSQVIADGGVNGGHVASRTERSL